MKKIEVRNNAIVAIFTKSQAEAVLYKLATGKSTKGSGRAEQEIRRAYEEIWGNK